MLSPPYAHVRYTEHKSRRGTESCEFSVGFVGGMRLQVTESKFIQENWKHSSELGPAILRLWSFLTDDFSVGDKYSKTSIT